MVCVTPSAFSVYSPLHRFGASDYERLRLRWRGVGGEASDYPSPSRRMKFVVGDGVGVGGGGSGCEGPVGRVGAGGVWPGMSVTTLVEPSGAVAHSTNPIFCP